MQHRTLGECYAEHGDISQSGLFVRIEAGNAVAVGDELAVELPELHTKLPSTTLHLLPGNRLRIVRITRDGVGATFL